MRMRLPKMSCLIAGEVTTHAAAKAVRRRPPNIHAYTDLMKARTRVSDSAVLALIHAGC
jgi:hypothetical protein